MAEIKSKVDKRLFDQELYSRQLIERQIVLSFNDVDEYIEEQFKNYAKKHFMNRCLKEGYISGDYIKIISYSAGKIKNSTIVFDVLYEFDIFYPYEGKTLYAKVQNITKIGIKAVIYDDEKKNPIIVFANRIHNNHIVMGDDTAITTNGGKNIYSEGDIINVKVLGSRFEINDPCIFTLGEIIESKAKIIY